LVDFCGILEAFQTGCEVNNNVTLVTEIIIGVGVAISFFIIQKQKTGKYDDIQKKRVDKFFDGMGRSCEIIQIRIKDEIKFRSDPIKNVMPYSEDFDVITRLINDIDEDVKRNPDIVNVSFEYYTSRMKTLWQDFLSHKEQGMKVDLLLEKLDVLYRWIDHFLKDNDLKKYRY